MTISEIADYIIKLKSCNLLDKDICYDFSNEQIPIKVIFMWVKVWLNYKQVSGFIYYELHNEFFDRRNK